jgi:hypothetical protein
MAMRATAAANLAVVLADHLVLHFVVPDPGSFAKAANQVTIQPRARTWKMTLLR